MTVPMLAHAAVVIPQLEKLPQIEEWIHQVTPDAKLTTNDHVEAFREENLQRVWERTAYKNFASTMGLHLPHGSDPDNRDPSTYIQSAGFLCIQEVAEEFANEPSRLCKHAVAQARTFTGMWHFFDLFAVHNMPGKNTFIFSQDTFHDRASACSNIQFQIDSMWGANFDFEDPDHIYDKMLRDGFIGKRTQDISNNLSPEYKAALKDHIENDTFVEFWPPFEEKRTHPDGVVGCDLGP